MYGNKFAGMPGIGMPGMQPQPNWRATLGQPMGGPGQPMAQPGMMAQRYMDPQALEAFQVQQQQAMQARQAQQSAALSARQPMGQGDPAQLAALQQRQQYASGAQAQRQALQDAQAARLQAMTARQGEQVGPREMARRQALIEQMTRQRNQQRRQLQQNRPGMLVAPPQKPGM